MSKEVKLYLHRETQEIVVELNHNLPHADNNHYAVKPNTTPPETLEDTLEKWENNTLREIPTQPTSALWPLNYPQTQASQKEVPIK